MIVRFGDAGTYTDRDGLYRLSVPSDQLRPDGSVFIVERLGMETVMRALRMEPGDSVRADFRLCFAGFALEASPFRREPPRA